MTPQEALKKAKENPSKEEQLFRVTVSYNSNHFILPHKAAMQLMDALGRAEVLEYSDVIRPSDEGDFRIEPMSRDVYYQMKAAQLLRIPYQEFKKQLNKEAA